MFCIILYFFVFINIDDLLNTFYLQKFNDIVQYDELLNSNSNFFYTIIKVSEISLIIYISYIITHTSLSKSKNKDSLLLSFIYIRYLLNNMLIHNMTLFSYGFRRCIMWAFTTPIMIKQYSDLHKISIYNIGIEYNIMSTIINVCIYPYKYTRIYNYLIIIPYILMCLFIKKLFDNRDKQFTYLYINVWCMFACINTLELLQLLNIYTSNICYLLSDMIGKFLVNIIIYDYIEYQHAMVDNLDLQCIHFTTNIMNGIKLYREDNKKLSMTCDKYISLIYNKLLSKIPVQKDNLQIELLQKLLPFGFDKEYISHINGSKNSISVKRYNMVCILFTDIVNYTELANKHDDKTIFELLNNVYNAFDTIIKRYSHLQKIETIGDAYMVIGDINRTEYNHQTVIKEMVSLALDFIKEVKTIETPDKIPLMIRIGMTIGKVSIGILGNEIPRLCVVGNHVNVASRLQSTTDPDTIQICGHIYEQIEELNIYNDMNIIRKENVFLKNLGSVTTYIISPPPL